jgi:hypothetical protein
MKNSTKAKLLAGALGAATLFNQAACDNGSTSTTKCECPNGTAHQNLPCCNGIDCNCIQWKTSSFTVNTSYTVTIEDQTGIMPAQFFQNMQDSCEANVYIANNAKIIIESQTTDFTGVQERPNHTFAIHKNWFDTLANGILAASAIESAMTSHIWANAKSIDFNIRLANSKDMNINQVIMYGRQFSAAKQIIRDAFRPQRQA